MGDEERKEFDLVFGKNPVLELIENSDVQVNKIWISESIKDSDFKNSVISYSKSNKVPYNFVPDQKLNKLTNNKVHQGVVLSISPTEYMHVSDLIQHVLKNSKEKIILIAHETEDNHNLGAMIRTFVGAGGEGIILTGKKHVGINGTTIKTSAGTLFQVKFARVVNCINALNELKENGFWVVGTEGSEDSQSIYQVSYPEQVAVLMGNEHEGFGPLIKKNCDFLVKIPINAKVESLNVSVAFGIVMFEILRKLSKIK